MIPKYLRAIGSVGEVGGMPKLGKAENRDYADVTRNESNLSMVI